MVKKGIHYKDIARLEFYLEEPRYDNEGPSNQLDEVLGWICRDIERNPKLDEVKNGDLERVDDMMRRIKHNSAGCTCEGKKCGKDCVC
jgi:hypothetical protein